MCEGHPIARSERGGRWPLLALALSLSLSLLAGPALAVPAYLIEDGRASGRFGDNCDDFTGSCTHFSQRYEPPAPFVPWGGTATPLLMEGTGSGWGFSDYGWSTSWSTYSITFSLPDYTEATLEGEIELWGEGDVYVRLEDESQVLFERVLDGRGFDEFLFETILGPGVYEISAYARAYASPDNPFGRYDMTLALGEGVAVPEPGTATLLGLGLAGTAWRARRRAAL